LAENVKGRNLLGDIFAGGRMILKCYVSKIYGAKSGLGLTDNVKSHCLAFVNTVMNILYS
jgi:hypothetical protein